MHNKLQTLKSKLEKIDGVDVDPEDEQRIKVSVDSNTYPVYIDDDKMWYRDNKQEEETEVEPFIEIIETQL